MGADVVDLPRRNVGVRQRQAHGPRRTGAVGRREADVEGVGRERAADDLTVDPRAAPAGVVFRFKHHDAAALAHDAAIAVLIEGAAGFVGLLVAPGEGAHVGQGDDGEAHKGLRAAGHHHVGLAKLEHATRVDEGLRARGARGDRRHHRSMNAIGDRDLAGGHVRRDHGNGEGADASGPTLVVVQGLAGERLDTTSTRVEHDADTLALLGRDLQARILQRLAGRRDRQLGKAVHAARGLDVHEVPGVKVLHFGRDLHVEPLRVNRGHAVHP